MDKNAIKKYAVWARTELIDRVSQKALQYGITEKDSVPANATSVNGVVLSNDEMKQRKALLERIAKKGYKQVMEEVAYTWFNRFSALRFMEVNGYLPSRVRVFTDENNQFEPQIITEAIDLEMDGLDMEKVYAFKDANDKEGLFKYLIIVQCNALSPIMPRMFQRIADYTELLFPDNLLREGSAIQQMIELIPEEDWKDAVQIIGWLYQFYNIEPKAEVFAKTGKISKEEIPAATQLFTPDWIVRYMVENSLGRLWVEGHPNDALKSEWKYYLDEAEQETEVKTQLDKIRKEYATINPEQIKCIDPCSGSGHICAYMFDVLMQIYEAYGYTSREAVRSIVENNIYGLDIDERAAQLAYFSVMMKARQYDKRFLARRDEDGKPDVSQPHVYEILESNGLDRTAVEHFIGGDPAIKKAINSLIDEMHDAKEYGSILKITPVDFDAIYRRFDEVLSDISMFNITIESDLLPFVKVAEAMAQKYDITITNPPYMGNGSMGAKLSSYVKKNFHNGRNDLFAVFIEKCKDFTKKDGFQAMITQHQWMFLSSYALVRESMLNLSLVNMAHLGPRAFEEISGEVVQTTAFVFRKSLISDYSTSFFRLVDFSSQDEKEQAFLRHENNVIAKCSVLKKLPGSALAYWISDKMVELFGYTPSDDVITLREGIHTGRNDDFLRQWQEVDYTAFIKDAVDYDDLDKRGRWVPYNKGGSYRKWYGNNELVIGFDEEYRGRMAMLSGHVRPSQSLYFKAGATWSALASGKFGLRYYPDGYLFDSKGQVAVGDKCIEIMALFNLRPYQSMADMIMPTLDYKCGDVKKLPYCPVEDGHFLELAKDNIRLAKEEWDCYETSWDFKVHPLCVSRSTKTVEQAYSEWEKESTERFNSMSANEELMNQIFARQYDLPESDIGDFDERDITLRKADKKRDIKSLISYAVGCMFGRYSLDVPGLAFAGGKWDDSKYTTFKADKDSIIPICDDEYFSDDIVGRFVRFIEIVYGKDTLQENLRFIADVLGGNGQPVEVIRNYFLNDFYADHLKIYQKRPIYWLFDSGKKNGFKALVYMHRYQPDTIARMRTDYVHEQQSRYRTAIADIEQRIASASTSERVKLNKKLKTLQDQAAEIQTYEEKIHHLADQYISIDLDDGVKKNYAIFDDVLAKIK